MNIGDKIPEILGVDQNGHQIKASDFIGNQDKNPCGADSCSNIDESCAYASHSRCATFFS